MHSIILLGNYIHHQHKLSKGYIIIKRYYPGSNIKSPLNKTVVNTHFTNSILNQKNYSNFVVAQQNLYSNNKITSNTNKVTLETIYNKKLKEEEIKTTPKPIVEVEPGNHGAGFNWKKWNSKTSTDYKADTMNFNTEDLPSKAYPKSTILPRMKFLAAVDIDKNSFLDLPQHETTHTNLAVFDSENKYVYVSHIFTSANKNKDTTGTPFIFVGTNNFKNTNNNQFLALLENSRVIFWDIPEEGALKGYIYNKLATEYVLKNPDLCYRIESLAQSNIDKGYIVIRKIFEDSSYYNEAGLQAQEEVHRSDLYPKDFFSNYDDAAF